MASVKVIVEVPTATPIAMPDAAPIVVKPLLLVHVPAPALVSVVVVPTHTDGVPPMAAGSALTVTVAVRKQPLGVV